MEFKSINTNSYSIIIDSKTILDITNNIKSLIKNGDGIKAFSPVILRVLLFDLLALRIVDEFSVQYEIEENMGINIVVQNESSTFDIYIMKVENDGPINKLSYSIEM